MHLCFKLIQVGNLKFRLPDVQLANPALKERHWEKIFCIVDQEYDAGTPVCVRQLLDCGVLAKLEEVQTVAATASKEYSMLKMLEKMETVRCEPPPVAISTGHAPDVQCTNELSHGGRQQKGCACWGTCTGYTRLPDQPVRNLSVAHVAACTSCSCCKIRTEGLLHLDCAGCCP